jgi:hypothetical protein
MATTFASESPVRLVPSAQWPLHCEVADPASSSCAIGYPDPHPDSATEDEDVEFLKAKVDAGADYIVTQLFYDVDIFLRWKARCRAAGTSRPQPLFSYCLPSGS